jgi:predicted nucleotidyltransferase component of viral defense system
MQLKAIIKNHAAEKNISAQLVMQNYMLERLLERISLSRFKDNLIIKGGFLISSILGIEARTTMDLDTTVKGIEVSHDNLFVMFSEICSIPIEDNIKFEVLRTEEIRELDDYMGIRVKLAAKYPRLSVPLTVDVTSGDKITPQEISHSFKLMFDDREIKILAYNFETILAEKIETILSRSIANTRPRDYYDVYVLFVSCRQQIDFSILKKALVQTANKRGSTEILPNYRNIITLIEKNQTMQNHWAKYQRSYSYASTISFPQVCQTVVEIMEMIW